MRRGSTRAVVSDVMDDEIDVLTVDAYPLPFLAEATIRAWRYPGFAAADIDIPSRPLVMFQRGDWDSRDE